MTGNHTMRVYGTYFDKRFLPAGLAMLQSLRRRTPERIRLAVLCLDDVTYEVLHGLDWEELSLTRLVEFEQANPDVAATRTGRSVVEYYWTCTPAWVRFLMDAHADAECVIYLDADMYFFADPEPLFEEMGDRSILAIDHRYPEGDEQARNLNGRFNVGFLVFRLDDVGRACVERWRSQCIAWCFAHYEEGKFGDQAYLDEWPERYGEALCDLQHKGGGYAPWNLKTHECTASGEGFLVDGAPLIFFHFHKTKLLDGAVEVDATRTYRPPNGAAAAVYRTYGLALREAREVLPEYQREPLANEPDDADHGWIPIDDPDGARWEARRVAALIASRVPLYEAFAAYHEGDRAGTRARLHEAFRIHPQWRWDRQVLPVLIEATLGVKLFHPGRRWQ